MNVVTIGTRGSALAQWQTRRVGELLQDAHPGLRIEVRIIRTRGDAILDSPLHAIDGKGLFTREIEQAILAGDIDLAVHSLKDLPTELPAGLTLAAVPDRADPADVLVSADGRSLAELPEGATVFTSSLRRKAQLLATRADLKIESIRGNVDTRLRKFDESGAGGIVFASAGLVRLGLDGRVSQRFDPATFLPACGQGALAIEARCDDDETAALLAAIDSPQTRATTTAERGFLAEIGGGCHVPAGAWARVEDDRLTLSAGIFQPDGSRSARHTESAEVADAAALGRHVARAVLQAGGAAILSAKD